MKIHIYALLILIFISSLGGCSRSTRIESDSSSVLEDVALDLSVDETELTISEDTINDDVQSDVSENVVQAIVKLSSSEVSFTNPTLYYAYNDVSGSSEFTEDGSGNYYINLSLSVGITYSIYASVVLEDGTEANSDVQEITPIEDDQDIELTISIDIDPEIYANFTAELKFNYIPYISIDPNSVSVSGDLLTLNDDVKMADIEDGDLCAYPEDGWSSCGYTLDCSLAGTSVGYGLDEQSIDFAGNCCDLRIYISDKLDTGDADQCSILFEVEDSSNYKTQKQLLISLDETSDFQFSVE